MVCAVYSNSRKFWVAPRIRRALHNLEEEGRRSFKTSGTTRSVTLLYIPEDCNFQQHRCEYLLSHTRQIWFPSTSTIRFSMSFLPPWSPPDGSRLYSLSFSEQYIVVYVCSRWVWVVFVKFPNKANGFQVRELILVVSIVSHVRCSCRI